MMARYGSTSGIRIVLTTNGADQAAAKTIRARPADSRDRGGDRILIPNEVRPPLDSRWEYLVQASSLKT